MVQFLLDRGASLDSARPWYAEDLVTTAEDRGHNDVAALIGDLLKTSNIGERDETIHSAAARGEMGTLAEAIGRNANLVNQGNKQGLTPLHLAVGRRQLAGAIWLLENGASLEAEATGTNRGFRPMDTALWTNSWWGRREGGREIVGYLLAKGDAYDITVASAIGDTTRVSELIYESSESVNSARPSGKRPISAAAERGDLDTVRILLSHGANPSLPEGPNCPYGYGLWAAAQGGYYEIAEMLLDHDADPNGSVESCGTPTAVDDRAMRALMYRYGGKLSILDHVYRGDIDVLNAIPVEALHAENEREEGGLYKAVIRNTDWDMFWLLGARDIPVVSQFNFELFARNRDMTEVLLDRGMDPDISNWQRCTPLHAIAGGLGGNYPSAHWFELLDMFLAHGADINAIDEEYLSTPLGWAARCGNETMVEALLLEEEADPELAGAPWAKPIEWAQRRGHTQIVEMLDSGC